jgi:spore coat-associated protein N
MGTIVKKIIGLSIATVLMLSMVGIGVFAYFSDTEASASNSLSAGTLDLKTNDADGVTQTLNGLNLQPNGTVGPSTITLKNAGSIPGATLGIVFAYVENDASPNTVNMTADATAAVIEVITLTYDSTNLLTSVSDSNSNGYKDVQDLKNANLSALSGINAGATKNFTIAVKTRSSASGDFQSDGVTVTMTFTLNQ